jgi:hypothetical protein
MTEIVVFWMQTVVYVVVGILLFTNFVWPLISKLFGKSLPTGVTGLMGVISGYVDEASAGSVLATAALLFKKHGDVEAVAVLGTLWGKAMAWDEEVVLPTPVPVVTKTAVPSGSKIVVNGVTYLPEVVVPAVTVV